MKGYCTYILPVVAMQTKEEFLSTILTKGFDKPILTKDFDIPLDSANLFLRARK